MKKSILILDNDIQYAKKISNYGIKYKGKEYIFLFFTSPVAFEKYQSKNKSAMSLINIDLIDKVKSLNSEMLFIITNEQGQEKLHIKCFEKLFVNDNIHIDYIYKFSSAQQILDYCIDEYKKNYKENNSNKTKSYLIFSPIGRCGKTILSYAFASELSKTKNVLYISLNSYESMGCEHGLSQVIYDFKNNKLTYENLIKQIDTQGNLYILYGVSHPEDISQVTPEEIDKIINEIISLMDFDIIVIDSDNNYSKSFYLFSSCDTIILPTLKDDISKQKKNKFLNFVKEQNIFEISKIKEIDMSLTKDTISSSAQMNKMAIKKAKKVCAMV